MSKFYRPRQFNEIWFKFLETVQTMVGFDNGKTAKQLSEILFEDDDKEFIKIIYRWIYFIKNNNYQFKIPLWSYRQPKTKRKIYYLPLNFHDFQTIHEECGRRIQLADFYTALHQQRADTLGVKIEMKIKKRLENES